jgi:hypothetical protein
LQRENGRKKLEAVMMQLIDAIEKVRKGKYCNSPVLANPN